MFEFSGIRLEFDETEITPNLDCVGPNFQPRGSHLQWIIEKKITIGVCNMSFFFSPSTSVSITDSIQFCKSMYPSSHLIRIPAPRGHSAAVTRAALAVPETDCVDHWDFFAQENSGTRVVALTCKLEWMCACVCLRGRLRAWEKNCEQRLRTCQLSSYLRCMYSLKMLQM